MQPVPLISVARVAGFANLLDARGVPADRYLERAQIPQRIREDPAGFLPGRCAWAFLGEISHREGLRDLCTDVARLSDWQRSGWALPLARAVTLGDALRAMCVSYVREIPMVRLGLSVNGPVAWFWRRRIGNVRGWNGNEPAEQYMLSFMLAVVRAAAGPGWLPERLKLESPASGWGAATTALPGVRIQYDQPLLGVAIPVPLLSLPTRIEARTGSAAQRVSPPESLQDSLREVLRTRVPGSLPSQSSVAEMLGRSERSLRRGLAEEGTSWRAVVHDHLFACAARRLREGGCSVREIAEDLGYSDTAHFTRFFRSRAGVPPNTWREQIERARSLVNASPEDPSPAAERSASGAIRG